MKNTVNEEQIVNVFITHKHDSGAKYIEACQELLDRSIERAGQLPGGCGSYRMIYDSAVIEAGDAYSKLNDFYDITDVDLLILSKGVNESPWVEQELKALQARGVTIIPIFFEGDDINDVLPGCIDCGWLDLRYGKEPGDNDVRQLANKLRVHDKKTRKAAVRKALDISEKDRDGYRIKNYLVHLGGDILSAAGEGAVTATKSISKAAVIALIVLAILAILGITLTRDEIVEIVRNYLS